MKECEAQASRLPLSRTNASAQAGHLRYGFTLVEILAAMFVLAVGLASVASIVLTSTRTASAAADRNNAAVIIPEALADIERMMLVNANAGLSASVPPGTLMDTVRIGNGGNFDNVSITPADPSGTGNQPSFPFSNLACQRYADKSRTGTTILTNLAYWPMDVSHSRVMGQFPVANVGTNPLVSGTGLAYRGLFKLEPHPDWNTSIPRKINPSAFVGVYVLTFTLYRDLDPRIRVYGVTPTLPPGIPPVPADKRLIQVTDPVVKYLKDKVLQ